MSNSLEKLEAMKRIAAEAVNDGAVTPPNGSDPSHPVPLVTDAPSDYDAARTRTVREYDEHGGLRLIEVERSMLTWHVMRFWSGLYVAYAVKADGSIRGFRGSSAPLEEVAV